MLRFGALTIPAVAAALALSGRASAEEEPTSMMPDAPGVDARAWVEVGPRPLRASPTSADAAREGSSSSGLVISGAVLFVLGAAQVPMGIGLVNARDEGANVAGVVNLAAGISAVLVGVPLLVVGVTSGNNNAPERPGDEELALVPAPGGAALRWSF